MSLEAVSGKDQLEFFINQLKTEIYDMKQKSKDINQLRDQYAYLENQYRQLLDAKADMEYQQTKQIQYNQDTLTSLNIELDDVRAQNARAEEDQDLALEKVRQLILQNQDLSSEVVSFQNKNGAEEAAVGRVKRDIERLEVDFKEQQHRQQKQRQEISRHLDMRNARDHDIQNYQARIESMNRDCDTHEQRISHLQHVLEEKNERSASLSSSIAQTTSRAKEQNLELQGLDKELMYQEQTNEKLRHLQNDLQKQNEQDYYRGKDLEQVLVQALATQRELEREAEHVQFDIDALKAQNMKNQGDQVEMQQEIEALNKHLNLLNQQNYELSVELEKFIEADEVVRKGLNRREKVEQIRHKVDDAIRKSQAEVERRTSPERGARRH